MLAKELQIEHSFFFFLVSLGREAAELLPHERHALLILVLSKGLNDVAIQSNTLNTCKSNIALTKNFLSPKEWNLLYSRMVAINP
jgi:hypothetical protein